MRAACATQWRRGPHARDVTTCWHVSCTYKGAGRVDSCKPVPTGDKARVPKTWRYATRSTADVLKDTASHNDLFWAARPGGEVRASPRGHNRETVPGERKGPTRAARLRAARGGGSRGRSPRPCGRQAAGRGRGRGETAARAVRPAGRRPGRGEMIDVQSGTSPCKPALPACTGVARTVCDR